METKAKGWRIALGLCTFLFGSFAHADLCTLDLNSAKVSLISPQSDSQTPVIFSISNVKKSFEVSNSQSCVALVEIKVSKSFLNDDPSANNALTQSVPLIVLFAQQAKGQNIEVLNVINRDATKDCGALDLKTVESKNDQKALQVYGKARPCGGGTAINQIEKTFSIKNGKLTILSDRSAPLH